MPLDVFIARWVSVFWLAFGLSHALHPALWTAMLLPLRERESGGLWLASFNFPIGLAIVLGHNLWVWDLPVIITVAGWMTTLKSAAYLVLPRAHVAVMSAGARLQQGLRIIGIVMIALGLVAGYDAFFRR
jgi:hypothetical protein